MAGRAFRPGTPKFGEAFETGLLHELVCSREYVSEDPLAFWRQPCTHHSDLRFTPAGN